MSQQQQTSLEKLQAQILTELETAAQADYQEKLQAELAKLDGMGNAKKRRATVLALAEAEVTPGMTRGDAFKKAGVVNQGVFYGRDKTWNANTEFREILDSVIALTVSHHAASDARRMTARRTAVQEREWQLSSKMMDKVEEMLNFPTQRSTAQGGKVIIEPSNWTQANVAPMAATASKLGRLSAGMETDKQSPIMALLQYVDMEKLTDDQLARIEAGEDPIKVLLQK